MRRTLYFSLIGATALALAFTGHGARAGDGQEDEPSSEVQIHYNGSVIKGFKMPRFAADGTLIGRLFGERATVVDTNRTFIEHIRYMGFSNGTNDYELVSNSCMFLGNQGLVESEAPIRITRPSLTITGTGFTWDTTTGKGTILSRVCMTIENASVPPELK